MRKIKRKHNNDAWTLKHESQLWWENVKVPYTNYNIKNICIQITALLHIHFHISNTTPKYINIIKGIYYHIQNLSKEKHMTISTFRKTKTKYNNVPTLRQMYCNVFFQSKNKQSLKKTVHKGRCKDSYWAYYIDTLINQYQDAFRWLSFKTPYLQNHYFSGETKNFLKNL